MNGLTLQVRQDPMPKGDATRPYPVEGKWYAWDSIGGAGDPEYMVDGGWLSPALVIVFLHEVTEDEGAEMFRVPVPA